MFYSSDTTAIFFFFHDILHFYPFRVTFIVLESLLSKLVHKNKEKSHLKSTKSSKNLLTVTKQTLQTLNVIFKYYQEFLTMRMRLLSMYSCGQGFKILHTCFGNLFFLPVCFFSLYLSLQICSEENVFTLVHQWSVSSQIPG